MKKLLLISCLAFFGFIGWLLVRQPEPMLTKGNELPAMSQATSVKNTSAISVAKSVQVGTNGPIQTASGNEDIWNNYRRLILEANQPVEFYARVLDQHRQPVVGAKLTLKLGRVDEKMFVNTNYLEWDAGRAVQNIFFALYSDSTGWFQISETNGSLISVWGLTKEGYLSSYPDGNFGGVSYEPGGRRNPSGDILMTNAWNPNVGYTFHLEKQ